MHNLFLQQILLVEEENDRGVLEPGVGDDGAEEGLALLHAVLVVRLDEDLVVLAQRRQEHDRGHVLEAVDPLAALGPLAAHVHHPERDVLQHEGVLDDAGGGHAHPEHVLLRRQVVGQRYPVHGLQVAERKGHKASSV